MTALPSASATSPPAPAHHPVSSRCSWVRLQCFLLLDDLHGQVARSGLGGIGDAVRAGQEDLLQVVLVEVQRHGSGINGELGIANVLALHRAEVHQAESKACPDHGLGSRARAANSRGGDSRSRWAYLEE